MLLVFVYFFYSFHVVIFSDVNECAEGADNCHRETNATCTDIFGSFMCSCSEGFTGNGTFCTGM